MRGDDDEAHKKAFSPEFRNRLDGRIRYQALDHKVMTHIVDKFVNELSVLLADRKVTIEVDEAARAYLAEKGYDPQNGARPLAPVMESELKLKLGDEILFGQLENGGHIRVGKGAEELSFAYEPRAVEDEEEEERDDEVSDKGPDTAPDPKDLPN